MSDLWYHGTTLESWYEIMRSGGRLTSLRNYVTARWSIAILHAREKGDNAVVLGVERPRVMVPDIELMPKYDAFYTLDSVKVVGVVHVEA